MSLLFNVVEPSQKVAARSAHVALLQLPAGAAIDIDHQAICAWLVEHVHKPNTFRAYAREARRFLLWWRTEHGERGLRGVGRGEIDDYLAMMANPPAHWMSGTESQGWRPFRGPVSPASRRQALLILQSLFEYLVRSGHLSVNPMRLLRDKGPLPRRAARQVPSEVSMAVVREWLRRCATAADASPLHARDAFVWEWCYWTGAHRHDLEQAKLGHFGQRTADGRFHWWWQVTGKGQKPASIPVADEAIEALAQHRGVALADLPTWLAARPLEPLVPALRGELRSVADGRIYAAVRRVAERAERLATDLGLEAAEALLIGATRPRSLRAYRATHLLDAGVDARHVQYLLRHADINSTLAYDHRREDRCHDAIAAERFVSTRRPLVQSTSVAGTQT